MTMNNDRTSTPQRAFPVVITGHVDHGKSTLIGRLLYDTGTLSHDRYEEMRQSSREVGRSDEFAFVLDSFEEERRRGITIDTSQIFFSSKRRPYVIIDAPGHREFIRNMLTGASVAEAAVLVLDVSEGIQEQTRRHVWLLNMVGIRHICIAINKLDAIGYDREPYLRVSREIKALFAEMHLPAPLAIMPISALTGENIASRSSVISWYYGPCLLEILDSLENKPLEDRPFRFPVQDHYPACNNHLATIVGRVEAGSLTVGMTCRLLPENRLVTIDAIRSYPAAERRTAACGEAVGIVLSNGAHARRGDILAAGDLPVIGTSFRIHLFWFLGGYTSGDTVTIRCATQEVTAKIQLEKVYDPATPDALEQAPDQIMIGEVAIATVITERPLVVDYVSMVPELGRIVINYQGQPAGAGLIL
jgi:sulfate adenylyltransferase subunit 1